MCAMQMNKSVKRTVLERIMELPGVRAIKSWLEGLVNRVIDYQNNFSEKKLSGWKLQNLSLDND